MKRLILPVAIAALFAASCGDVIEIPEGVQPSGNQEGTPVVTPPLSGDVVFTATSENLPDGTALSWKAGEKISLYDGSSVRTLTNDAEAGPVGRFPCTLTGEEEIIVAVRPAQESLSMQDGKLSMTIPSSVDVAEESSPCQIANASGTLLYFRNLLSSISFKIGYEGATKVCIKTTDGSALSGDAIVDFSGDDLEVTATSDAVELCGNFVKGTTYTVSVAPGTIEGYTITGYSGTEKSAEDSGGRLELVPGGKVALPVLGEEAPVFRITNLWLWGGTGPEYNCTKIHDLFTKASCFNSEDGRGVTALLDNYFEMRPDGTFRNWAGADGRNWWFVFAGSANPETGKDVDLTSIYDVLPRGEGSWSFSGNSLTLTKPDGTSSTASILTAGTYPMPVSTQQISVTISEGHIALQFVLTGGKDNWNHTYDDYGVIAAHPRILFFEMEQLPSGTKIPDASKTTDTDFEYVPPQEQTFDLSTLPGKWEVYGTANAPYGLYVLGGSGDDPAFLSPLDKSWCFDNTLKSETDNELVITPTSVTSTTVAGEINWSAGADGRFWNYTWKFVSSQDPATYEPYYGTDLSQYYDKIPKGVSDFSLDIGTMTATLSNGEKPKLLIPGTHVFAFGKSITIPEGCIALAFHIQDKVPATDFRWKDIDRFMFAPLEYVIIFEKP